MLNKIIMKNDKGFIGVGFIVAVVVALLVGGGVVYYITKTSTPMAVDDNYLPVNDSSELPESLEIKKSSAGEQDRGIQTNPTNGSISVISPNGGETFTAGQQMTVKWSSSNLKASEYLFVALHKDGLWDDVTYFDSINDGNETFTIPLNASGKFKVRVGSSAARIGQDYSDNFFIIKESSGDSEESLKEVFDMQPGEIKSIKTEGNNKWVLAVDLLSRNPKWIPGVDSTGGFFINQNLKIRNLNVTNLTKTYKCEGSTPSLLVNTSSFINEVMESDYKTRYFDINGTNITAIYQQCLP